MNLNEIYRVAACYAVYERSRHAIGSFLDYQRSLLQSRVILDHYPPAIMVEPASICNLACPMCPSGNGSLTRERGFMSLEIFSSILEQVYRKIGVIMLWNQGEAFLNKDFYTMLEQCVHHKMFAIVSTNASFDLDIGRLVKSKPGKVIVSIDGLSNETYQQYRINGDYLKVMGNLRELANQPSLRERLVWQFIVMKHNEHEVPKVKDLAGVLGIKRLEFKTVQIYKPEEIAYLPSNPEFRRYKIMGDNFTISNELQNRCRRLWTQPVINQDGEMAVCCYDKDQSIQIGNIRNLSFEEMWFGAKMNAIRKQILFNRSEIEICRNCGEGIKQRIDYK